MSARTGDPSTVTGMPAATTVRAANLTDAAAGAIAQRLTQTKDRTDVEVLAVTDVTPACLSGVFSSVAGLAFAVEFTYTTGRRQRRTARVAWGLTESTVNGIPAVPPPVWELLQDALTIAAARP